MATARTHNAAPTTPSPTAIRAWMKRHADEHREGGEVNLTNLVEAWDRACSTGAATMDPGHVAWEVAIHFAPNN